MEATIQLQIDSMHPVTKELLQQQQRRRSRPASEHPPLPLPADKLKGSVEKGHKRFNSPKSSKVKKVFSLLNKAVRLNFSSYKCKLLKFSLTALLTSKKHFLDL